MLTGIVRAAAVLVTSAALALMPVSTDARVPEYQRVIKARFAAPTAPLVRVDGCIRTEVWADSSDNVFGGRPGRVNKQGLTSVLVIQYDACAAPQSASAAADGGTPGQVVFDGIGQTRDRLNSTPRFDRAWVDATVPVLDDISGLAVPVRLDLTWRPIAEFDRETVHSHVRVPHEGIVNSHSQTLTAGAAVRGDVWIGKERMSFGPTQGAVLSQVKYGCQVILHPRAAGSDLSC